MKIDWDKDNGDWRIFDMSGVLLDRAKEIVIEGTMVLVHDERERHGWAIADGKIKRINEQTILIEK